MRVSLLQLLAWIELLFLLDPVVPRICKAEPPGEGAKEGGKGALFEMGHRPGYSRLYHGMDVGEAAWIREERGGADPVSCVEVHNRRLHF